jgi:hypothetical protein
MPLGPVQIYRLPHREVNSCKGFIQFYIASQTSGFFGHLVKTNTISGFCSHFMVEGWPPRSFSAPVAHFYGSRFGFQPISGDRQERITLSSVSDKQLM